MTTYNLARSMTKVPAYYLTDPHGISDLTFHQDFLNYTTLVNAAQVGPTLDLTRTTTKPYFDASGNLVLTAHNLSKYSNTFSSGWVLDSSSVATGISDADGGTDAWSLIEDGTASTRVRIKQNNAIVNGSDNGIRVRLKYANKQYVIIKANSSGTVFDIQNGTLGSTATNVNDRSITSLGDGWYECFVDLASDGSFLAFQASEVDQIDDTYNSTNDEVAFYLQNVHTYLSPADPTYVPTTSAAVYDTPAFDHDPANSNEPLGLLINEAHTNLLLQNRDFTTTWTQSGTPTEVQDQTGIDGVDNKAWTLGDDDGGGDEYFGQNFTVSDDSLTHTCLIPILKDTDETRFPEIQLKYAGGTAIDSYVQLNTKTGVHTVRTETAVTSAEVLDLGLWWGVVVSSTNNSLGNTTLSFNLYPAVSSVFGGTTATTGSIVVDMPSLWKSSNWYYPVETAASAVTVNADYYNTTDVSWYDESVGGTFYHDGDGASASGKYFFRLDANTNDDYIRAEGGSSYGLVVRAGGVSQAGLSVATDNTDMATHKMAIRIAPNDTNIAIDGTTATADTSVTLPTGMLTFELNSATQNQINRHISEIKYWNTRKSDAELQALTT